MTMNTSVAIIGAGGWGTALAIAMAHKTGDVRLWAYEPYLVETMIATRENPIYLPSAHVPEPVRISNSMDDVLIGANIVIMAVPSHVFRPVLGQMKPLLNRDMCFLSAAKGIENETLMRMSEVIVDVLRSDFIPRTAVLSGPTFAAEVAAGEPTAMVAASPSPAPCRLLSIIPPKEILQ
jgi:glycerol-3-phosphate dehydrogenase (NAD(P)+)